MNILSKKLCYRSFCRLLPDELINRYLNIQSNYINYHKNSTARMLKKFVTPKLPFKKLPNKNASINEITEQTAPKNENSISNTMTKEEFEKSFYNLPKNTIPTSNFKVLDFRNPNCKRYDWAQMNPLTFSNDLSSSTDKNKDPVVVRIFVEFEEPKNIKTSNNGNGDNNDNNNNKNNKKSMTENKPFHCVCPCNCRDIINHLRRRQSLFHPKTIGTNYEVFPLLFIVTTFVVFASLFFIFFWIPTREPFRIWKTVPEDNMDLLNPQKRKFIVINQKYKPMVELHEILENLKKNKDLENLEENNSE